MFASPNSVKELLRAYLDSFISSLIVLRPCFIHSKYLLVDQNVFTVSVSECIALKDGEISILE